MNVDITTEDLRRRLEEGKVYTTERIETALTHFFRQSNLEQLRELTLRELAAQIDSRHRAPLADDVPSSPDQVMVCLSSRSPNSEALLRYASRLAGRLNRNWYAVYVQTSSESPTKIDSETQRVLSNALTLAQQLGATVFTYKGEDVVKTILQFAKEYRVGHVVVGRSGRKLPLWKRLPGKSTLVQRLVEEAKGITVVVLDTREVGTGAMARAENSVLEADKTIRPPSTAKAPASSRQELPCFCGMSPWKKKPPCANSWRHAAEKTKRSPRRQPGRRWLNASGRARPSWAMMWRCRMPGWRGWRPRSSVWALQRRGCANPRPASPSGSCSCCSRRPTRRKFTSGLLSLISRLTQHALLRQELLKVRDAEEAGRVLKEHVAALEPHTPAPN